MLTHALLFESGKVSLGFFSVADCVNCLDSESIELDSVIGLDSERLDSVFESEVLNLRICVCFGLQICQIRFCV